MAGTKIMEPDFDSVKLEWVNLPYAKRKFLKASFTDELLKNFEVIMIADSLTPESKGDFKKPAGALGISDYRISTIVARFNRTILSEWNTHRVFSRNSASSRARSVKKTIHEVMTNPYIPVFTRNQKGMSGKWLDEESYNRAKDAWLLARDKAVASVLSLLLDPVIFDEYDYHDSNVARDYEKLIDRYYDTSYSSDGESSGEGLSIHKQDVNRILEPYMWHEVVNTSTYWENFLDLRNKEDAQPTIRAVAVLVDAVLRGSDPVEREYHIPFVDEDEINDEHWDSILESLLKSAAECAQISYNDKSDKERATGTSALGERLISSKHLSPFEHQALTGDLFYWYVQTKELEEPIIIDSNLSWYWIQFRKIIDHRNLM